MSNSYPSNLNNSQEQEALQVKLDSLALELEVVQQKTVSFESMLRSHLESSIIEVQELTVLYKQQKSAKKEKRITQKKRGKNYREVAGLQKVPTQDPPPIDPTEQQEKKRLYREAMFHVHPDKFSMDEDKLDLATTITTKVIDIYKSGDLETLRAYHAHIFHGHEMPLGKSALSQEIGLPKNRYLEMEIEKMEKRLEEAKNRHTYKVLETYKNPMTFLEELKEYYEDRLFKLRKRTRKG
ncbi:hypothetical protein [Sediminicola sp. 1XM1-17]|uniref:hypothetical protein n=1 Tax=Sediminicola sp. 1XM1-17 TaxID=3127702 RepID=UPI003077F1EA